MVTVENALGWVGFICFHLHESIEIVGLGFNDTNTVVEFLGFFVLSRRSRLRRPHEVDALELLGQVDAEEEEAGALDHGETELVVVEAGQEGGPARWRPARTAGSAQPGGGAAAVGEHGEGHGGQEADGEGVEVGRSCARLLTFRSS